MIKTYFNLKNYNKYIVTKYSNPRNRGHPPHTYYNYAIHFIIFSKLILKLKNPNILLVTENIYYNKKL